MASDEYWEKERVELLDPKYGAHSILSDDPRSLLRGYRMFSSLEEIIKLRILGLESEVAPILEHFPAMLQCLLDDKDVCDELRNPTERRPPSLIFHLNTLAIAQWLRTGNYDPTVLTRILDEIHIDPEYELKSVLAPRSTNAIICAAEYGDIGAVEKFYKRWEKKPLEDLPDNLRFASNPRHVVFLHVRFGTQAYATETLEKSLERLSTRARNWEKFDAVPYFGIVDLARTVFLCENLRGKKLTLDNLWCLLK